MNAGESSKEDVRRLARLCRTLAMNRGKAELVRALEIKDLRCVTLPNFKPVLAATRPLISYNAFFFGVGVQ